MARRSIIQQYLDENQKKEQAMRGEAEAYEVAAADYNAWLARIKNSQDTGVLEYEPGKWAQVGGHEGEMAFSNRDKKGNPYDSGALYDSLDALNAQTAQNTIYGENGPQFFGVQTAYVRNPDGTIGKYAPQQTPISYVDASGNPVNPNFMGEGDTTGIKQVGGDYQYVNQGNFRPVVGPTTPNFDNVKFFEMSRRQEEEYGNPTLTGAEAELAVAKGQGAKTDIANQPAAKNSPIAERDYDDQLKEAGILSRVLAGKL